VDSSTKGFDQLICAVDRTVSVLGELMVCLREREGWRKVEQDRDIWLH
jgi:hypothetical protein